MWTFSPFFPCELGQGPSPSCFNACFYQSALNTYFKVAIIETVPDLTVETMSAPCHLGAHVHNLRNKGVQAFPHGMALDGKRRNMYRASSVCQVPCQILITLSYLTPKMALLEAYFVVEETTDKGLNIFPRVTHLESSRPEIQTQVILTPKSIFLQARRS